MKLTIIGTQASYATTGRANASYLISEGETNILIDLGNGSLSRLLEVVDPAELDALIISHMHHDHFGDIYPLRLYLYFEKRKKIKLFLPPKGEEIIGCSLSDNGKEILKSAFEYEEITENSFKVSNLKMTFKRLCHGLPTFGVSVSNGQKKLAYTADTKYCPELIDLSKNADILLSEATFPVKMAADHMTAAEAGKAAAEADCKRLILTHIWPSLDPEESKKQAAEFFRGPIEIAKEGQVYEI